MLMDQIRSQIDTAVREKDEVTRDVLRVALGEAQTLQSRSGSITEQEVQRVVRKLVEGNRESIRAFRARASETERPDSAMTQSQIARLEVEIATLEKLLPQNLSLDDIRNRLAEVGAQISSAKSEGQAIGLAMKHLKNAGVQALGEDVKVVVQQLRSSAVA